MPEAPSQRRPSSQMIATDTPGIWSLARSLSRRAWSVLAGMPSAVTGASAKVFRVPAMEAALDASFTPGALDGITVPADDLASDLEAQADYRAHLIGVIAKRAVTACSA